MSVLEILKEFSGIFYLIIFVVTIVLFFTSLKNFLKGWKKEYTEHRDYHFKDMKETKGAVYQIKSEVERQGIHQSYMKEIAQSMSEAVQNMGKLVSLQTETLKNIENAIRDIK